MNLGQDASEIKSVLPQGVSPKTATGLPAWMRGRRKIGPSYPEQRWFPALGFRGILASGPFEATRAWTPRPRSGTGGVLGQVEQPARPSDRRSGRPVTGRCHTVQGLGPSDRRLAQDRAQDGGVTGRRRTRGARTRGFSDDGQHALPNTREGSPELKRAFLDRLVERGERHGRVRPGLGLPRTAVYYWKHRDRDFARAWDLATWRSTRTS